MFAISASASLVPTRVRLRAKHREPFRAVNTQTKAYVNWVMDGVGCASARSGDEQLLKSTKQIKNNVIRCPTEPMNLTTLCKQKGGGFFKLGVAAFEQRGDDLFVTIVQCDGDSCVLLDGKAISYDQRIKLKPGAVLTIDGETWQLNRNTHAHA
jgi:hypothetical protein